MEGIIQGRGKRRRRPKISCTLCRRRKIGCNRERPYSNCVRFRAGACVYEDAENPRVHAVQQPTLEPRVLSFSAGTLNHPSSYLTTSPSDRSRSISDGSAQADEATRLKLRIKELEDQLASATLRPVHSPSAGSSIETTDSRVSGPFHVHYKRGGAEIEPIVDGLSMKTRFFGQSHWAVSIADLCRDSLNTFEPYIRQGPSNFWAGLERCKYVARRIKARRAVSWASTLTSKLPSRVVSDALVDHYLRTIESLYRILHIPTFYRNYEELWTTGIEQDVNFLIQLKLVLAVGTVTYDDRFSLRSSAIQWVYEAQAWISGPKHKARLNFRAIQTNILLLIAQERVWVDGDPTWVSSGAFLRKAMHMGLHRDPRHHPQRTAFAAEMHRRLWNTILEINLQSSLTYGGAPLISLNDFDTSCPGNFDDEQLEAQEPTPKPEREPTQVSTLHLDAELRGAYRELSQTLRPWTSSGAFPLSPQHETMAIDFIMQRYFSALHTPYFGPAHGPAYAYSQQNEKVSSKYGDLSRLVICSSGFYQASTFHALQEDGMCPAPLQPELLSVLQDAKTWCLMVIRAGGTSVKGYLLMSLLAAQVEGMMQGLDEAKIAGLLETAIESVQKDCLPTLEETAAAQDQKALTSVEIPDTAPLDVTGDWDFMTPDPLFNLDGVDPMSWMFNDDSDFGVASL
ncbi:uncharacterized protein BDV17DRAFT_282919 [Aspergillus undulatus]|uniref:uncharacterized protein n=1 Tax=Aspergillus undulatus TaxID=1810928 RepID=UPI003CCDFCB3